MCTIERAIAIAATAHEGKIDKGGTPYVFHPLRLMMRMATIEERIVAVLHDVVEDSAIKFEDLEKEGFSSAVLEALESVTRRASESYDEFVLRAAANPIGRRVKLVDLEDNCDISRIPAPTEQDYARIEKYRRAIETINALEI